MASSSRAPSIGLIFLARSTSSSTGRSVLVEHQPVGRVLLEPEPAVARHRLGDVHEQRVRDGVAAVAPAACRRPARRRGRRRARSTGRAGSAGRCARARGSARARRTGAIALRQSCARSWSISRSRVLSDWTMSGPSVMRAHRRSRGGGHGGPAVIRLLLLPGAVGGDVGPGGAPVRAVAAGLVGGGVDEDVVAAGGVAHAEPGGAEVAHRAWTAPSATPRRAARRPRTAGRRRACATGSAPSGAAVTGDVRRHRVLGEQRVEPVHHRLLVAVVGRLEDRPQLARRTGAGPRVPLGHRRRAARRGRRGRAGAASVSPEVGVDQAGRALGVTNKVHP